MATSALDHRLHPLGRLDYGCHAKDVHILAHNRLLRREQEVQITSRTMIQLCSSIYLALMSFVVSVIVTNSLTYVERQNYGIFMVTLGQLFVWVQFGAPGAFNSIGLATLKASRVNTLFQFFIRKDLYLVFIICVAALIFELPSVACLIVFLGYSSLLPLQWIVNGIQKHVSNIEYSFWRILFTNIQFLILLYYYSAKIDLTLIRFIEIWCFSNFLSLVLVLVRFFYIEIQLRDIRENISLSHVSIVGKSGLVAHIGLSDLIRLENFLIPLFLPTIYSANYFAVGGLANWPRLIIDSVSLSYFHGYKSLSLAAGRRSASKRLGIIFFGTILILTTLQPFGDKILESILGSQYSSAYNLFFALSAMTLLSSGRRMYLDSFRAHGKVQSQIASKLELKSWIISLTSLPSIFYSDSIVFWAWSSVASNSFAVLYLIRKGNRC